MDPELGGRSAQFEFQLCPTCYMTLGAHSPPLGPSFHLLRQGRVWVWTKVSTP